LWTSATPLHIRTTTVSSLADALYGSNSTPDLGPSSGVTDDRSNGCASDCSFHSVSDNWTGVGRLECSHRSGSNEHGCCTKYGEFD
jgi:hypothetical protein